MKGVFNDDCIKFHTDKQIKISNEFNKAAEELKKAEEEEKKAQKEKDAAEDSVNVAHTTKVVIPGSVSVEDQIRNL
jgi:hypothetical protein